MNGDLRYNAYIYTAKLQMISVFPKTASEVWLSLGKKENEGNGGGIVVGDETHLRRSKPAFIAAGLVGLSAAGISPKESETLPVFWLFRPNFGHELAGWGVITEGHSLCWSLSYQECHPRRNRWCR